MMMNHAMIVEKDGKSMRLPTQITMKRNMRMKLMMRDKSYVKLMNCRSGNTSYPPKLTRMEVLETRFLFPNPNLLRVVQNVEPPIDCPLVMDLVPLLRKNFKEDLLTYCGENETSKDFEDISEYRWINTKRISNDLGIKRFRGEEIDEEYKRDCEIRIQKHKQDFNEWGSKVRKKEQAYEEEKYFAARRYMLSMPLSTRRYDYIPSGDIITRYSTSKAITPDLPIEEPDNSLNTGDEHLDTILATESDEVIKSSVENLVPIPSEFKGISDDTSDEPTCR
ncbi:hypothetical protein Tco_0006086 [Tanacetum coccineum]